MKTIYLLLILIVGCSSQPKQPEYGGAMAEIMRSGVPQMEAYPDYYSQIQHTCTSTPIWDMEGQYVRTDVRCY